MYTPVEMNTMGGVHDTPVRWAVRLTRGLSNQGVFAGLHLPLRGGYRHPWHHAQYQPLPQEGFAPILLGP